MNSQRGKLKMNKKHHITTKYQNQSFKVPDGYFDSLEERIEARIANEEENLSPKGKLIRMIKPLLAMAASFAIIFMLVYYPLSVFLPDYLAKNAEAPVEETNVLAEEELWILYFATPEEALYQVVTGETEQPEKEVNADEMLDYLATAMNETEIYAALKN
jgi:hypothetical protein